MSATPVRPVYFLRKTALTGNRHWRSVVIIGIWLTSSSDGRRRRQEFLLQAHAVASVNRVARHDLNLLDE